MSPTYYSKITITYYSGNEEWLSKATFFAQELQSTFPTTLNEVSICKASNDEVFTIKISVSKDSNGGGASTNEAVLWDRTINIGFPDVESLKGAVRDIIEPGSGGGNIREVEAEDEDEEEYEEEDEGDDLMLSI
ncbi:hypothetical protein B9Z19DRAFT_1066301 [Tuber borchii]|uniref:Rdx family-domain-containing protein n=1 Tax=Tuber borchii TaxID=42251 RepID=A0A2T6ZMZ9_TUBBO|nr:hypothetical protein B9Z19DRAFT_1066301 [Tuber borchii]